MLAQPTILILAAGQSKRFRVAGGNCNKLDAKLQTASGTFTVLQMVIRASEASGLPWHVVTHESTRCHPLQGMGTSIATGVQATSNANGWLVLPGDLPLIQPESILAVANAMQFHSVVVPLINGIKGHPVGFGHDCREALQNLNGEHGARSVVSQYNPHLLPLDDLGCTLDVDTPERLAQTQRLANQVNF